MGNYTVNHLISSKTLSGLRLAAGAAGAGNEISNVNTIDNPDTFGWMSPGDFLLSTGYIFKDDTQLQLRVVRELAKINCAGLGLKTKRYLDTIPRCMREEAERLGFPLVEIPYDYSLAEVANEINSELLKREDTQLKQYIHIHNTLTNCSLQGGSLYETTRTICELVGNPVVLVDSKWRLLAYADREQVLHGLLPLRLREQAFPSAFPPDLKGAGTSYTKIITRHFPDEEGSIICRIKPVRSNQDNYGYLVVFEIGGKLTHLHNIAIESAATAIALERIKAKQIQEVKHQLRQDFFDDLLHGKIESVNAVSSLAEIHNMDAQRTYLCMLIKIKRENEIKGETEEERNAFLQYKLNAISSIEELSLKFGRNTVSIHRGNLLICFIRVEEQEMSLRVRELLGEFPEAITAAIQDLNRQIDFIVGVGNPISDYLNIRKSYLQAHEAIRVGERIGIYRLNYYDSSMVYHLLDSVSDEVLEEFYTSVLGRLEQHDRLNGTDLIETLEQYFICNTNISTAAKKMFLHRNTLIYRIEKIKEILNSDLKNADELLELQIALRIQKILGERT